MHENLPYDLTGLQCLVSVSNLIQWNLQSDSWRISACLKASVNVADGGLLCLDGDAIDVYETENTPVHHGFQ